MDNKFATFIVVMLLTFTVSAARLALDPPATNHSAASSDDASKLARKMRPSAEESLANTSASNSLLPVENVKSNSKETTANNYNHEPEKPTNDSTPRTNFSRFHPINRHFLGKPLLIRPKQIGTNRRPCRKHAQYRISRPRTRTEISDSNHQITAGKTDHSKPEGFRGEIPSNWLKLKHHYSSRGQQNNHRNRNENNEMKTKNVFDREKLKSLIRQHKDKKREEEARLNLNRNMNSDLMKSIRKFLKHTFD